MKCNIVGLRNLDYVNKETGERVTGSQVFYTFNSPQVDVGLAVGVEFINESLIKKFPDLLTMSVGDVLLLDYTKGNEKQRSQLLSAELIKPSAPSAPVERKSGMFGK